MYKRQAEQYGIKGCTYEEILADPSIEMVVILTPAPTHEGLIRQALEAGKHVYTEKTMTLAPETAAKLIELAEEKHLYLGSAPDTFLGSALQTARKAIDDGLIGEVTSFEACANRDLDLLASIFRFLRMPGGGICYDFGVYYLTAIVSLFGPVDRVVSSVRNLAPKREMCIRDSYMDLNRGTGSIGNGSINSFALLLPETFTSDLYTEIYIQADGAQEEASYSDAYDETVKAVQTKIEALEDAACDRRYTAVKTEGQEKIDDAKQQVADAEQKLADAKTELDDGAQQLADAKVTIADKEQELLDGEQTLKDKEQDLSLIHI